MEQVIQIKMSVDELKSLVTDAVRETFSQKEENDELLTVTQMKEILHIVVSPIWRYENLGILKPIRVSRKKKLYKRQDIDHALKLISKNI